MEQPWYEYIEPDDYGWDDRKGELYPLYDQACVDALIDTINCMKDEIIELRQQVRQLQA